MTDIKAGWEVEGFIKQLTQRNEENSERLVLAAISHLRAFSRDCDGLRETIARLDTENERLREALQEIADDATPGDDNYCSETARRALEPKP